MDIDDLVLFYFGGLIVFTTFMLIVVSYNDNLTDLYADTHNIQDYILFNRIIDISSYRNPITSYKVFGTINKDLDKDYILEAIGKEDEKNFGFELNLAYLDSGNVPKEIFYNQEFYEYYRPLIKSGKYDAVSTNALVFIGEEQGLLNLDYVFRR